MSRIIAGSRGGRRISVPPGERTRPTTDRVREALFSAVAAWAGTAGGAADEALTGLAFCDLYAGSGAIGLEAASRGAAPVRLVESDKRAARVLGGNASELGLEVVITTGRVEELVRSPPPTGPFDVVFADPPYALSSYDLSDLLALLTAQGWIAEDGLMIIERSTRSDPLTWPEDPADVWSRDYGESVLYFWQR